MVKASVRGIGVAVMLRRWGTRWEFFSKAERCSTPKRCCSSSTASPSSLNLIDLLTFEL